MASSSPSKSALKRLAATIAARLSVMQTVRIKNHQKFHATVTEAITSNTFVPGECMVLQIAKKTAKAFGISEDDVEVVPMHNGWLSAQFTHRVKTPMPPPQGKDKGKGQPQPPVETETVYKVVKASGMIRIYREHRPTNEKEENLGGEFCIEEYQRPPRTP